MSLYEKSENWWLRLIIVIVVLGSLTLLSLVNRSTMETTNRLQLKIDSLTIKNEMLEDSIFGLNHQIGINELVIDDLDHQPRWKGLSKAVEKDRDQSNKFE